MYDKYTLRQAGTVTQFLNEATMRIDNDREVLENLKRQVISLVRRVGPNDLVINQTVHEAGKRRWCSEALSEMQGAISSARGAHCVAVGASNLGLSARDIRGMHAIVLYRVLSHTDIGQQIGLKSRVWPEAVDAYKQLLDYLNHKARSREAVNRMIGTINLPPIEPHKAPQTVTIGYTGPAPGLTARDMELQNLQRSIADKLIDQLQKPGINVADLHAFAAAQQFLKQEHIATQSAALVAPYGGSDTIHESKDVFAALSARTPHINLSQGNDTMLGTPISPFNFNKPAIEEIKFVYGLSVKELTVDRLTALLADRQAEVDRLKALPHKPEVIKAKIATLKGEIKEILALTNELFPVEAE